MYNLLMVGLAGSWDGKPFNFPSDRVVREYTVDELRQRFLPFTHEIAHQLSKFPAVFAYETGNNDSVARIGWINNISIRASEVRIEYAFEPSILPFPNTTFERLSRQLDIQKNEMYRTHWAVKDVDLFAVLVEEGLIDSATLQTLNPDSRLSSALREPAAPSVEIRPSVFRIPSDPIDQTLISLMMPFDAGFNSVHAAVRGAIETLQFQCKRADDIWEESEVIQDVVALIARSKVVICDFSDRNSNVFYEAGIAHTIGRPVIPITQRRSDIPFDLQHHRYIEYHNNAEGLRLLADQLRPRITTLMRR